MTNPNTLDFQMVGNNTVPVQFTVYRTPAQRNSTPIPIDITGYSIVWNMFSTITPSPVPVVTKSTGAGSIVITDGPAGVFLVNVLAADTVNLPQGYYTHEAVTVDLGGKPLTITNNDPLISAGQVFLRQEYTAHPDTRWDITPPAAALATVSLLRPPHRSRWRSTRARPRCHRSPPDGPGSRVSSCPARTWR